MDHDEGLVQDIVAHPEDTSLRLIYADWLEERDDPRAEFLRLEVQLAELKGRQKREERDKVRRRLRQLRATISPDWLARLDRTVIENCRVQFAYQCPKRWENLQQVQGNNGVRFCAACSKKVYFCWTVDEARRRAAMGNCVAVDSRLERRSDDLRSRTVTLGIIAPPPPPRVPVKLPQTPQTSPRIIGTPGVEREREVPDRHELQPTPRSLRRGGQVMVLAGRWQGQQGFVERVNQQERTAVVRVRTPRGYRRLELDLDDVEAI
jgi:uncharacterized protein (TIGR02996 family)